jgi:hypothetical protein
MTLDVFAAFKRLQHAFGKESVLAMRRELWPRRHTVRRREQRTRVQCTTTHDFHDDNEGLLDVLLAIWLGSDSLDLTINEGCREGFGSRQGLMPHSAWVVYRKDRISLEVFEQASNDI